MRCYSRSLLALPAAEEQGSLQLVLLLVAAAAEAGLLKSNCRSLRVNFNSVGTPQQPCKPCCSSVEQQGRALRRQLQLLAPADQWIAALAHPSQLQLPPLLAALASSCGNTAWPLTAAVS